MGRFEGGIKEKREEFWKGKGGQDKGKGQIRQKGKKNEVREGKKGEKTGQGGQNQQKSKVRKKGEKRK